MSERAPAAPRAKTYIRLLDVSYADEPARVVAEQTLAGARDGVRFALRPGAFDPQASYTVAAHVDLAGDGQVSKGDFISMESYPVLTRGYPHTVEVTVRRV